MVVLSGPIIVFGFVVVVVGVLGTSCAVTPGVGAVAAVVEPFCVCPVLFVAAFAAEPVVALPLFFFTLAATVDVDVLCAVAIEPTARNALTQKLAANFKYRFIGILSRYFFSTASSTSTPTRPVDTTSASPSARVAALRML